MLERPPGGATIRWPDRRGMLSSIWAPEKKQSKGHEFYLLKDLKTTDLKNLILVFLSICLYVFIQVERLK